MIFIIDFDGTLATQDTVDALLEKFAPAAWEAVENEWLTGRISAVECMRQQIRMVRSDRITLESFFRDIQLDPYFDAFQKHVGQFATLAVVSDGLDHAIKVALQHNGLAHLPIHANRLHFLADGIDISFPHLNPSCNAGNGVCKCAVAQNYAATSGRPIVLIGDGKSDACLAHQADVVFAKGSLIQYCAQHQIPHYPFQTFADVMSVVRDWSIDATRASVS